MWQTVKDRETISPISAGKAECKNGPAANALAQLDAMVSITEAEHETRPGLCVPSPEYSGSLQCRNFPS